MNFQKYSTYVHPGFKLLKKLGIKKESDFFDACNRISSVHPVGSESAELSSCENYSMWLWKYRDIDHYFLDSGVADFCVGAVKFYTRDYFKPMPEPQPVCVPIPTPAWIRERIVAKNKDFLRGAYCIHFPTSEQRNSVLVVPSFATVNPNLPRTCNLYLCSISDGVDIVLLPCIESGHDVVLADTGQHWLTKLIYGIGLYVDAFPDAVNPTSSRGFIKNSPSLRTNVISATMEMMEESQSAVSPHYRRGHFRVLSSERYINKKGQTVFVKGSFVRGTAHDVLDDA